MTTNATCPETEELHQLLGGSLSGERQLELTQHMDSCGCCQAKLEEVATGGTNLSHVVKHLYQSEPAGHFGLLAGLEGAGCECAAIRGVASGSRGIGPRSTGSGSPGLGRDELPLDFLGPATDTAYLGRLAQFDVMRSARPRRHGHRAGSVRLQAPTQRRASRFSTPSWPAMRSPGNASAARPGRPHRSRTKTSSPCIRSRSRGTKACRTW